jgi:ssDNA-binding Zn-finger/Zn-ribbon topoisomerase 1
LPKIEHKVLDIHSLHFLVHHQQTKSLLCSCHNCVLQKVFVKLKTLEIIEVDGFLKAKNSTLGADNGIGVAIMMDLMSKREDLEFLWTNDEEIGLIGAGNLKLKPKAKKLINLDSEDENIYIGCAGGCEDYPNCKFSANFKPTNKKCPECGYIMGERTFRNKEIYECLNHRICPIRWRERSFQNRFQIYSNESNSGNFQRIAHESIFL